MSTTISNAIKKRILEAEEGSVFMTSDFFDIARSATVRQCLGRLVDKGLMRRVMDGTYEKPRFSPFLKEYLPTDPEAVARAIAKRYHWNIAPSGDVALNKLGLSTQIPTVWSYISDGPYREFTADGFKLSFKRRANRDIGNLSDCSIMVIEALKTLGKNRVDANTVEVLKSRISDEQKATLLRETSGSSEWIYDVVRKICS